MDQKELNAIKAAVDRCWKQHAGSMQDDMQDECLSRVLLAIVEAGADVIDPVNYAFIAAKSTIADLGRERARDRKITALATYVAANTEKRSLPSTFEVPTPDGRGGARPGAGRPKKIQ